MRLATIVTQGQRRVGHQSACGQFIELFEADASRGLLPLVEQAAAGATLPATSGRVPVAGAHFIAPIPRPRRDVFCVGRNYHAHASELRDSVFKDNAKAVDSWPIVFGKLPESVIGPGAEVRLPGAAVSTQIDYEAELAVVIGAGGRNIARADALGHVFGYTIVNDVTARTLQHRHRQWILGKGIDGFCPMGPAIVTADAAGMPPKLSISTWVNGELRQRASVDDLIFGIPTLIATISAAITLEPGDIIATGTPAGVGIGFTPPKFLKPGDKVRIEVPGIGVLENPVA